MASEGKVAIAQELNEVVVHVVAIQRIIKAASPLASGLTVMKSLDKLLRAVDRIKIEIGDLPI